MVHEKYRKVLEIVCLIGIPYHHAHCPWRLLLDIREFHDEVQMAFISEQSCLYIAYNYTCNRPCLNDVHNKVASVTNRLVRGFLDQP